MTRRFAFLAAVAVTLAAVVVGWSSFVREPGDGDARTPTPSASPEPSVETSSPSAEPTRAVLPPVPKEGTCHRLSYAEAVAPTTSQDTVPCDGAHTSVTFAVGQLDSLVDGHLVTVDSERIRDQVTETCPAQLADHVGGTLEQQRLTVLRAVGFTPTVEQSDRGADWYRCDIVAVARDNLLAPLGTGLTGVLDTEAGRDRYGLCSTAGPGDEDFRTVICSGDHSWRAVRTVTFDSETYPGTEVVRAAGTAPCRAAGRAASGNALNFQWGYEWPTAERWRSGRTYGICWVPD